MLPTGNMIYVHGPKVENDQIWACAGVLERRARMTFLSQNQLEKIEDDIIVPEPAWGGRKSHFCPRTGTLLSLVHCSLQSIFQ